MVDTVQAAELRNLRKSFESHETQDESRFKDVREDIKENQNTLSHLQNSFSELKGRLSVLAGLAIVSIPVIQEFVHAWLGPHIEKR